MFPSTRKVALNRTKLKDTTCPNMMPPPRLKTQQNLSEVGRDRTFYKMEQSTGPQQAEETARRTPGLCDNSGRSSDKNMNPIPTSPAGSEASLKRTVQSSGCELCDNFKIISPRRRTLVRQVAQKLSPCSEQHKSIQTSKKVLDLTVNLCDVVRMSGARCYNCGFVLPHGLENKPVYCFKEDIAAAGLQLRSSCSGHQKDGSDEHQSFESGPGTSCDTIGTEISGGKTYHNNTEFLTHRATLRVTPDLETMNPNCLSNEQTRCSQPRPEFTVGMRNEVGDGPETCAMPEETPGLFDDDPGSLTCQRVRLYVWKRKSSCARTYITWHDKQPVYCFKEDIAASGLQLRSSCSGHQKDGSDEHQSIESGPGTSCGTIGTEISGGKTYHNNTEFLTHRATLRVTPDLQTMNPNCLSNEQTRCSQPRPEFTVGMCDEVGDGPETCAMPEETPGLFDDDPGSLTCQRVRLYVWKRKSSCARTYITWHDKQLVVVGKGKKLPPNIDENAEQGDVSDEDSADEMEDDCKLMNGDMSANRKQVENNAKKKLDNLMKESKIRDREDPDSFTIAALPPAGPLDVTGSKAKGQDGSVTSEEANTSSNKRTGHSFMGSFSKRKKKITKLKKTSSLEDTDTDQESSSSTSRAPLHHNKKKKTMKLSRALSDLVKYTCSVGLYDVEAQANCSWQVSSLSESKPKQLVVSGFMNLETRTSDFAQTEEIPPVSLTPREPSPSFDTSGDAGDRVDSGRVEEMDEKATEVRGNAEQLESEQTMSTDRPPDAAECGPPFSSSDHDDDESFNGEGRSPSSHDPGSPGSPSTELADSERCPTESGTGGGAHLGVLDEFTAYQRDILLIDVDHDDSELFDILPQESLLKLGSNIVRENPKTLTTYGVSQTFKQSWTPVNINRPCDSSDNEENPNRPWRPKKSDTSPKSQSNLFGEKNGTKPMVIKQDTSYASRDHVSADIQERDAQVEAESESRHPVPPLGPVWKGPSMPNTANKTDLRCPKIYLYCSVFFSGSQSCNDNICRFLHVPMKGDEKFCVNTVSRFTKNPLCLQKAGALFTSYYQHNTPGMFFSVPVFLSLLWTLLKADIIPDVLSVLSVALAHKIVPTHEFLLALFTCVREKGFTSGVPRLLQLTYKMASENLMLSLDCFDGVQNIPEFQQIIDPNVPDSQRPSVSDGVPISCSLILAHVIVEIELCTEQEDWCCLGKAFRSICTPCQHPSQVERISGHVAIALLSKTKDNLSVPFAAFAETTCPTEDPNSLLMGFIGRIGVSLMQRYHKTQQWAKGRSLMEVLTRFKINYSMQRGLFANEDGGSRCNLITLAAELFFLGGSLEGALQTLRESKWFVSSNIWPCKQPDLERRSRLLAHLAEKASHRDALEVLRNLPGIQKPNYQVDISKYTALFNTHLQVCVDRLVLPVASDLAYLMLSRKVPVDGAVLQALLHKLGKQNQWQRARQLFGRSLTAGHYPAVSAPAEFMSLIVPSQLGEVELALTFEMLITVNASFILPLPEMTPTTLNIILKRSQESEKEYLSAGSRLLSAALIPQPNLEVHYTTVNSSQEQVFTLSVASALRWLRRNQMWANKLWSEFIK